MELTLGNRLKHAFNVFRNRDPTDPEYYRDSWDDQIKVSYSFRPDRPRSRRGNERTVMTAALNKIALDVSSVNIRHVKLDENDRIKEYMKTGLNECLTLSANLDQTGRSFIQDIVMSMLDEGCVAIVPVDTTINPYKSDSYDIKTMRTGKILEWFPDKVKVELYNERTGRRENVTLPKKMVGIVENPLYSIMNEPNSTMQRLIRKLNLLDMVDEQSGSGKLDMIIQLPYVIKTEARRQQAEQRKKDIEMQLSNSKYGIAYTDGAERITQLNRPLENNLMKQVEYLTSLFYSQLGITQSVLDGSADEKTMLNYYNRTVKPILYAIVEEMKRKFLTKTARTQGQSIEFFMDQFALVPVKELAEIADKFTRNEILTSNEFRQIIGFRPSDDPKADRLENSNINHAPYNGQPQETYDYASEQEYENMPQDDV